MGEHGEESACGTFGGKEQWPSYKYNSNIIERCVEIFSDRIEAFHVKYAW